jgi:hypothetical protein
MFERSNSPSHTTLLDGPDLARRVASALRMRRGVTDRLFDSFLPAELRAVSGVHWTPLVVAMRAAQFFEQLGIRSVVDIGSGAGKFCVAAALAGQASFVGVEQRDHLVSAARDLARLFEVEDRVSFVHATFGETVVPDAAAYYLYNPFGENLFAPEDRIDQIVANGEERYARDVECVQAMLESTRLGTYLLTYNGFGGDIPPTFEEVRVDRLLPNVLRLWRKVSLSAVGPARPDHPTPTI